MKKLLLAAASAVTAFTFMGPATAQDTRTTYAKVGVLACEIDPGVGYLVASSKAVRCTFNGDGGVQLYAGRIGKLGLDVGITGTQQVRWAVLAAAETGGRGVLQGTYSGVSAAGTIGVGLGANALLGGFEKSIVLQPISLQAGTGLNVAVGVAQMRLNAI